MKKIVDYFIKAKVYTQRGLIYYQILNSFILVILLLRPYDLGGWLNILIVIFSIVLILIVGYLDTRLKIMEREQSKYNAENKELQEVLRIVKKIKEQLDAKTH